MGTCQDHPTLHRNIIYYLADRIYRIDYEPIAIVTLYWADGWPVIRRGELRVCGWAAAARRIDGDRFNKFALYISREDS